jgi:hypothetical protein
LLTIVRVFFAAVEPSHVVVQNAQVVDGKDDGSSGRGLPMCEMARELKKKGREKGEEKRGRREGKGQGREDAWTTSVRMTIDSSRSGA